MFCHAQKCRHCTQRPDIIVIVTELLPHLFIYIISSINHDSWFSSYTTGTERSLPRYTGTPAISGPRLSLTIELSRFHHTQFFHIKLIKIIASIDKINQYNDLEPGRAVQRYRPGRSLSRTATPSVPGSALQRPDFILLRRKLIYNSAKNKHSG